MLVSVSEQNGDPGNHINYSLVLLFVLSFALAPPWAVAHTRLNTFVCRPEEKLINNTVGGDCRGGGSRGVVVVGGGD